MVDIHNQTVNPISTARSTLSVLANQKENTQGHYEHATSRKKKDEAAIQAMKACIGEWGCHLSEPNKMVQRYGRENYHSHKLERNAAI